MRAARFQLVWAEGVDNGNHYLLSSVRARGVVASFEEQKKKTTTYRKETNGKHETRVRNSEKRIINEKEKRE